MMQPAASDQPLLLLPGTLCDARVWEATLLHLGVRAACPTLSGAATTRGMAEKLLREAPERFALAGFSLGGIVALEMAAQAPGRVSRLALIASTARPDPPENAFARRQAVERFAAEGARATVSQLFWQTYVAPGRRADAALFELIVDMAEALGPAVFREQTSMAIHRADSRPRLPALTVPTLIVGGMEDVLCPPDRSAEIAAAMPGARCTLLPGVGHFVPLEAPEVLAAALAAWLALPAVPSPVVHSAASSGS